MYFGAPMPEPLDELAFQRKVAAAARARFALDERRPADALAELLGVSRAVAYKRLASQTFFSARELALLQEHLDVVVSPWAEDERPLLAFRVPARLGKRRYHAATYLQALAAEREALRAVSRPGRAPVFEIVSSDLPVFYYLSEPELAAFRIYAFGVDAASASHPPFRLAEFRRDNRALLREAADYAGEFFAVAATEIWSRTPIDNFLRLLTHLVELGLVVEQADALAVLRALRRMLDRLQRVLEAGRRDSGADFGAFCNETHYTSSVILVRHHAGGALYLTFDNPNFIISQQDAAVAFFREYFRHLQAVSDPIGRIGQRSAQRFVSQMRDRVERTGQRIRHLYASRALDLD